MIGSMLRYEQYDAGARGYSVSIPTPTTWSGGGLGGDDPVVLPGQPKTDYVYGYIPPIFVLSDGTPYSGKSHRMPNGQYMTGASHYSNSVPLIARDRTVRSIPVYSSSEGGFIGPLFPVPPNEQYPGGGTYTPIPEGPVYGPFQPVYGPYLDRDFAEGGGFVGAEPRYGPNLYVVPTNESQTLGQSLGEAWRERRDNPTPVGYDGRTRDPLHTVELCRDTTGDGILDLCIGPANPLPPDDDGSPGYRIPILSFEWGF